jgi:hypothetical protein
LIRVQFRWSEKPAVWFVNLQLMLGVLPVIIPADFRGHILHPRNRLAQLRRLVGLLNDPECLMGAE